MTTLRMGQKFKKTPAGEIPVDWEVTTFGDSFEFLRTANNSRDDLGDNGSVSYIHYGDLHTKWRTALKCDRVVMPRIDESKVLGVARLQDGDLVMADASEDYEGIGVAVELSGIGDKQVVGGLHTLALRDKGARFADGFRGYIQYVPTVRNSLSRVATGVSVVGLSKGNLVRVPIPRPPLEEQKRIAEILSSVDDAIEKTNIVIEKANELKKGLAQQLLVQGIGHGKSKKTPAGEIPVGWEVTTFRDAFDFLRTANNPRADLNTTDKVGYIHYGDLHTKWQTKLQCDRIELPRISQSKVEGIPYLQDGDLVAADASEDYDGIGVSVEVSNVGDQKIVAGLHTFLLRDKGEIFSDGFRGYIQYMPVVRQHLIKAATGVSVYGLSKGNLSGIPIPRPPLDEQKKIVEILSSVDDAIIRESKRKIWLETTKDALTQVLLTGRRRCPTGQYQ